MASSQLSFGLLATTFVSLASFAQSQPAGSVVSPDSKAGVPLFQAETVQLTEESIGLLDSEYAHLFASDDGKVKKSFGSSCKILPGDPSWPDASIWDEFDSLLDGALLPIIPIASPCYLNSTFDNYDEAECAAIMQEWTTSEFHTDDPGSVMFAIYEGKTCMPTADPTGSCTQGGYASYAVNVSTVAQIQLALNFARETDIRLIVRNTGHDYNGRSTGAGALSIWMHNLKDIHYVEQYNSSDYEGAALKVGAGVQVSEVYEAADKYGVTALGGICPSVGFTGGYLAGGGHSPLMPIHGMASDQILALEVVTADGQFVTATPSENSDLFWAMGGGGGGTFGIVTSAIVKAHPKILIVTSMINFKSTDADAFWGGVQAYWDEFLTYNDAHTYSYFWVSNSSGSFNFDMTPFWAPDHTIESFNTLVKPWFDRLDDLGIEYTAGTVAHEDFKTAYDSTFGTLDYRVGSYSSVPGVWLLPRANWETEEARTDTFAVIRGIVDKFGSIGGYHQAPKNPEKILNAVNPAFRREASFIIGSSRVSETAGPEELAAAAEILENEVMGPLRAVAPEGGAYLNEAAVNEPDWQYSFWGENYPQLLEVKEKWDPWSLFYVHHGVGSEVWEVRDGEAGVQTQNGRLCRV